MKTLGITNKKLYRLGGTAMLLGGLLGALGQAVHPADPEGPAALAEYARAAQPVHLLLYFAIMLILLGLPAVYARQSHKAGLLGLAGFVLMFIGLPLMDLVHSVLDFMLLPALVARVPDQIMPIFMFAGEDPVAAAMTNVAPPILLLGAILLAISTLRARVLSPWPAWLLLLAMAGVIATQLLNLPNPGVDPSAVLFYLALAGFGGTLLLDKGTAVQTVVTVAVNPEQLAPQAKA